jgi:C1A family cysteine protease
MNDQIIRVQEPPSPGAIPKLGRLRSLDERDRRFSMPAPKSERTFRSWLSPGEAWDQGITSQCVSFSVNRWLISHRVVNKLPMSLEDFYKKCQQNDEWEGESYDGTSVRAGMKVLKSLGLVSSYTWAFEPEQVIRHILEEGPVVVGTDWTNNMFTPDKSGYIWPTSGVVGGHAYLLIAVNRKRINPDESLGAVRVLNSWSSSWGEKGRAWLTFDALALLLKGLEGWRGEASTAMELRVR